MPDTPKTDSKKRMTVKEARMQKEKIKENRNYKIAFTGKSVPEELKNFGKKYVDAAEKIFEKAGFTNVKCIPLKDLNKWQLKKEGCVASITVDSVNAFFCEDKYDSDVEVVISYHSPK